MTASIQQTINIPADRQIHLSLDMDIFLDLPAGTAKLELRVTPKNEKPAHYSKETRKVIGGNFKNSPHFGRNGIEIVYDPQ